MKEIKNESHRFYSKEHANLLQSVKLAQSRNPLTVHLLMVCSHCPTPRTKKMAYIELSGGVILLRDRTIQISIGFCTHSIGICIGLGVGQCE